MKLGLHAIAMGAPVWALILVWFSLGTAVGLVIAAAVAIIVAGFIDEPGPDARTVRALGDEEIRQLRREFDNA